MLNEQKAKIAFDIKSRIQESLIIVNQLILEARENDLTLNVSSSTKTIGEDGDYKYYFPIVITMSMAL